jgi:molybdenum cofactor cytidylyltransferase
MNEKLRITALVLAAGKSSRMGCSKPLLPINGMPMLEVTLRKLVVFPFEKIICVTGYLREAIENAIQINDSRFAWVHNPNYAQGQGSSLRIAVEQCSPSIQGIFVFLADQPFIKPGTIERILSEAQNTAVLNEKTVIQPIFHGQKGHPVFFSGAMLAHFAELHGDEGARNIIRYASSHNLVPVEDEGVITDLDTMEDYEKYQPPK